MANIPEDSMNEGKGLPGLLFPFVPHSIETGTLQDNKDEVGGFPLYAVQGQPGKVWAAKPASADAVARVVEVVIGGTVAEGDKYSVSINGTKYEVTAPSTPTAGGIATALASAVGADDNYGASASSEKVTITASTAGAAANADEFVVAKTSAAGTITKTNKTAGADAVAGGTFIGIASYTTAEMMNCGYNAGDHVNVLKKGRLWVLVDGEVLAGQAAYINNSTGKFTANSSSATAIAGGVFKSNAASGRLAELEIA
ncbi:hypothetical protein SAMN05720470_10838 [Fibrobacter sp. UWOV1]|uniref:structural cement protein Gp24 n=1 Tax=Fibrobacter sp. UWOV1 TaxID=1896215 RepID=UPI00091F4BFB|nr:hypothetical protein [Fibrobacter sp. UWOV1]SHL42123.1 hypothetical protein SAMN05720470_10838 [Fibrobacter sp. UWOV1]